MDDIKLRSEIDNKYKWDLSKLENILNDNAFEKINNLTDKLLELKGKITLNSDNLFNALELNVNINRQLINIYVYSQMKYHEDTSDDKGQEQKNKIEKFYSEISEKIAFFDSELLNVDYDKIVEFIKENDKLKKYSFYLENMFRYKLHTLSEKEEKILKALSPVLESSEEVFSYLTDTDMEFDKIKDSDGKRKPFSEAEYRKYIESKDRRVRNDAFKVLFNEYKKYKNTIASTYINNVRKTNILSRIRGYNSSLEQSLFNDNVGVEVYKNLISAVHDHLPKFYEYMNLKKELLNIDDIHLYDNYVSTIEVPDTNYSFEECKDIVMDALKIMGDEYLDVAKKAFIESWIDVYPNKYKRSGAYSFGTYDSNPNILLNYTNKLDDVNTTIHELGHSVHSYFSNKNQDYIYSNYPIILAEIASTVNEMILANYLLKNSKDENEKKYIINMILDKFKSTIFRQTMFAEFELIIHEKDENNETLTEKVLSDTYYELNKKYFGSDVVVDDLIRYEWERIPHFYSDYYVYKYATGMSVAIAISNDIINGKDGALDNYIKFLSSGSKDYPLEILKECGYDLSKKDIIDNALSTFDNMVDEFKKLVEK